ncbi:Retrovirus-related Pol polyprotein from transposon TNT 1-94 [Cucumis melo var. makuwa]|uniref:Retrovirus-related Pol polyprotein from transposon TNT 1-94 n=1 Tax=Cucumis melo var. makuwa TaxID=1194695 RepID=A0A5D3E048_CUCMM|nr:Retrovirus-related Pol polyprotein from transposon TNT 1-94 [Cucumis melo var. makuwa]
MSIDQLIGSLQAHEEKLFKKNKQTTNQLFSVKVKLKDKEDSLEIGNRGRGRGGKHGHGDFRDRDQGNYSQRKFNESNSNSSNSSRGHGRQHYSRNRVEENANYAEKDEESGNSSLLLACKGAETCENSAWYLDSGASNHICGSKSILMELDESIGSDIVFGDASKILVKKKSCLKDPNWIWHLRSRHLNFDGLRLLARKNMVKGLSLWQTIKEEFFTRIIFESKETTGVGSH